MHRNQNLGWRKNGRTPRKTIGIACPLSLYNTLSTASQELGISRSRFAVEALSTAIARHLANRRE